MVKEKVGSCIIVGGGPAGIHVASVIAKSSKGSVDVTIVDRQNYLDWSVASPRSLAKPSDIEQMGYVMPLEAVVKHIDKSGNTKFVQGCVETIGPKYVKLEGGKTLEADSIVVAVGGQYASGAIWKPQPDQATKEARIAAFKALHNKISKCNSIVVAGAGPTGVEVAGELKVAFPELKITLVGSMLPNSPAKLQKRMKKALEDMKIQVKEGRIDMAEPDADGRVTTRSGEVLEGIDLILNAAGFVFSGASLADEALKVDVTKRGQFQCRPSLQLQSQDTIFCCGDILAVPEGCFADVKGIMHGQQTGETVAKNIVASLQGMPLTEFKWSKVPIQKPMMTALGPTKGVGYLGLPNFMENFMTKKFKCKDYYMGVSGNSAYGKGKTW